MFFLDKFLGMISWVSFEIVTWSNYRYNNYLKENSSVPWDLPGWCWRFDTVPQPLRLQRVVAHGNNAHNVINSPSIFSRAMMSSTVTGVIGGLWSVRYLYRANRKIDDRSCTCSSMCSSMRNDCFKFNAKLYRQEEGGSIGLDSTGVIALHVLVG